MSANISPLLAELKALAAEPAEQDHYDSYYFLLSRAKDLLFDDLHPEMAPFYFHYGSYIYEQCIFKENIFGEQVPKKVVKRKRKGASPASEKKEAPTSTPTPEFKDSFCTIVEEKKEDTKQENKEEKGDQNEDQNVKNGQPKQMQEEEYDDQQIAFQNLECAKIIYKKIVQDSPGDSQARGMAARAMKKLGDLLANMNKFKEAIEEYQGAIDIFGGTAEQRDQDRGVAEIRFMMAKVYLMEGEEDRQRKALALFYQAVNAVVRHLNKGKSRIYPEVDQPFMEANDRSMFLAQLQDSQEDRQLKEIVLELLNQVEDVRDELKHSVELKKQKEQAERLQEAEAKKAQQFSKPTETKAVSLGTFGNARKREPPILSTDPHHLAKKA